MSNLQAEEYKSFESIKKIRVDGTEFLFDTELIANLFRISQTEEKLKKDNVKTANKATGVHYEVGAKVRKAIEDIGGTMPEDLPTPEKSIKEIEKEQLNRLKNNKENLMLDE